MSRSLVNVPTPDILDNSAAMLRLRATVTKSTALMSIQHHDGKDREREVGSRFELPPALSLVRDFQPSVQSMILEFLRL